LISQIITALKSRKKNALLVKKKPKSIDTTKISKYKKPRETDQ